MQRNAIPIAHRSRALSSVYGKIEQLLLSVEGDQQSMSEFRLELYYQDLFLAFSDRVSFVVMGHFGDDAEQELREALRREGLEPELVRVHTPLASVREHELRRQQGAFIQDPFVVMESPNGETLLLEPYRGQLQQNAFLAEQFADATGFALLPTRYRLEGGNILIGDDYALVGRNLLERNRQQFFAHLDAREAEALITKDLKRAFGMRYLFWIGEETPVEHPLAAVWSGPEALQPFYHLDLFLTLGGKSKEGDEIVLVAEIDTTSFEEPLTSEQMDAVMRLNGLLKLVKDQLKRCSDKLPGPRFQLIEIPMSGTISGSGESISFTPYSYNNAQVEWYHGISRIYLPSFPRRKALQEQIHENLTGLGFNRVTFIHYDMEKFAEQKGGLHCLTKVLRRSGY